MWPVRTRGPGTPVSTAVPRPRGCCVKPQRPEPTGWGEGQSHPSVPMCFSCPRARSEDLASGSPWPRAGSFPVLGPVPAWLRTLLSGLTVRCVRPFLLMEKPLWAVRQPHKQNTRTFYISCSWVARKDYKSQLGLSQASHMPSAQSQNRHHPSPPEVTDVKVRILHLSAPPPPSLP